MNYSISVHNLYWNIKGLGKGKDGDSSKKGWNFSDKGGGEFNDLVES